MATNLEEPDWIRHSSRKHAAFDIIQQFLDNAVAAPENVQGCVDTTVAILMGLATPNPSADEYKSEGRLLWRIIFVFAKQIPAASVEQDYMVELASGILDFDEPETVFEDILIGGDDDDSSPLIRAFEGSELDAPLHPRLTDRVGFREVHPHHRPAWRLAPGHDLSADEWANLNAFVAKLSTKEPQIKDLEVRGLHALIEALEHPLTPSQLRDVLPAAANWVLYAWERLWNNDTGYLGLHSFDTSRRNAHLRGPLWRGQTAFNRPRWQFWTERLREIADRDDIGDAVRQAAQQAHEAASAVLPQATSSSA